MHAFSPNRRSLHHNPEVLFSSLPLCNQYIGISFPGSTVFVTNFGFPVLSALFFTDRMPDFSSRSNPKITGVFLYEKGSLAGAFVGNSYKLFASAYPSQIAFMMVAACFASPIS